jgi:hypothetical protein
MKCCEGSSTLRNVRNNILEFHHKLFCRFNSEAFWHLSGIYSDEKNDIFNENV